METVKHLINQDLREAFLGLGLKADGDLLVQPADLNLADFTCNLCFQLARVAKCSPTVLADKMTELIVKKYELDPVAEPRGIGASGEPRSFGSADNIPDSAIPRGRAAGFSELRYQKSEQNEYKMCSLAGYINFTVADKYKFNWLNSVINNGLLSSIKLAAVKAEINLEFISANPTGPLTLANGRAGFFGEALGNLLEILGHKVTREYYINDAGNQIKILGQSVKARLGLIPNEANYYQGEYLADLAEKFKDQANLEDEDFGRVLAESLLEAEIKPVIQNSMGIRIESWISEYRHIRGAGLLEQILGKLRATSYVYEAEGAVWLKTTAFGDDKDRVLIKADGEMTYFLVDIAYHYHKLQRGADKLITILGADHYGYVKRLGAGLQVLGYGANVLDIIILQMVKLYKGGAEVKMSKRAGNFVLMQQALDEVPADLLKFYLLSYNPNSQVDIDLDALASNNDKNPVYSVQYMLARLNSMLKKAEPCKVVESSEVASEQWCRLFRELYYLPVAAVRAAENYQPNLLVGHILSLALAFHKYYERERLIETDEVVRPRLLLIKSLQISLKEILQVLGLSAPEQMIK